MRCEHSRRVKYLLPLLCATVILLESRSPVPAKPDIQWLLRSTVYTADVTFSSDGRWMLTSAYPVTVLWDVGQQKAVASFAGWRSAFLGNRLFAVQNDRVIDLYEFPSLRRIYQLQANTRPYRLCASRDGRWLLVHYPLQVQLWSTMPPKLLKTVSQEEGAIAAAALSADGRFFAYRAILAYMQLLDIVICRTADGRVVKRLPVEEPGEIALSPDGSLLIVAGENITVYRVADGTVLWRAPFGAVGNMSITVSNDGKYLAVSGEGFAEGVWHLRRLSDGALVASGDIVGDFSGTWGVPVSFSPDSRILYLVIGEVIRMIDTATGADLGNWSVPPSFRVLRFCRGGEQIVTSDRYGLNFYATADGRLQAHVALPHDPTYDTEAISEDGTRYAVYNTEDGLRLFSITDGGVALPILSIPPTELPDLLFSLQWTADGAWVYASAGSTILRVRASDGAVQTMVEDATDFAVSADGRYLVFSTYIPQTINVLDIEQNRVLYTWQGSEFQLLDAVNKVAVIERTADSTRLYLYDLLTGEGRWVAGWARPSGWAQDVVTVAPDGQLIARMNEEERRTDLYNRWGYPVARWDAPYGGQPILFSPDSRYIAIGSRQLAIARGLPGGQRLSGTLTLLGWTGLLPDDLRYTLRDSGTGQVIAEGPLSVTSTLGIGRAQFVVMVPYTDVLLTVSGTPFLSKTVDIPRQDWFLPISIYLRPGDVDGDNEVTLFDFGQLVEAFGTLAGEERYNHRADLDGDGEVTLWDFGLLVENFGMVGDE